MFRLSLFGRFSLTGADGEDVPVTSKKAKALLAYLAQTPSKPRSREEILALLWSDREEIQGRASLRQVLTGLRKVVGEELLRIDRDSVALDPDFVEVVPSNGEEFLSGFHLTDPAFEEWLRDERLRLEDAGPAPLPPTRSGSETHTIEVLPFDNLSPDPDQAFFSDGITQDIVTELSRFSDLLVIAPPIAPHDIRASMISQEIGTKLNAEYILQGSVRQAGNRVRITARLTDAESSTQIWGTRYDRDLTEVFEIQEEVARHVATTVSGSIETRTFDEVKQTPQTNLSAYQHTLLSEWLAWRSYASPGIRENLEKAIAIDPEFARAYATLANWHAYIAFSAREDFKEIQKEVHRCSERAIAIAPNDTFVLTYLAAAHCNIGDYAVARHYIEKSIRLNPNHRFTLNIAAMVYAWLGETEASLAWLDRYMETAPLSLGVDFEVAFEVYYLAERYEDAIAATAGYAEISLDASVDIAAAYAQAGHLEKAAELRRSFEANKPEGHSFEAHAEAILRLCPRERERNLWREGYRKAGFL